MSETNKAIVRQLVDAIQNKHDLDAFDRYFTANFVNHVEHGEVSPNTTSVERAKNVFQYMFAAFPDFQATILDQVAEGDKVVTRKLCGGTHTGPFMGVAPTGKKIEFAVIDILRFMDGKVVEHWAVQDRTALLQQLGLLAE